VREVLRIRSRSGEYALYFIEAFEQTIEREGTEGRFFLVDRKVMEIYRERLERLIPQDRLHVVEPREENKTLEFCQVTIAQLVEKKIRRDSALVAIGGGILQDITGFTASILYRGIPWEFYPSTLLAQADSAIGSKTSVNVGRAKNLVGSFCPPSRIFIDTHFLKTLPRAEIRSGIGEILHYYLVAASPDVHELMRRYAHWLEHPEDLTGHIRKSLEIKKAVIERDEFDRGERNLFNYGHTFGHALETATGYAVNHGQAVTVGMDLANALSVHLGILGEALFREMRAVLAPNMPEFRLGGAAFEGYLTALAKDKKNRGNALGCVLTAGPGRMEKRLIPFDQKLKNWIEGYLREQRFLEERYAPMGGAVS